MARPEVAPRLDSPSGDDVFDLLGELRAAGFTVGVREHLKAQELALACRPEADGVETDPLRLRNWLAPALCRSPDEQREFYRVYETWRARQVPARRDGRPGHGPRPPATDEAILRKSRPWRWQVPFAGLLLLTLAGAWIADRRFLHHVSVPDLIKRPVADARRALEERELQAEVQTGPEDGPPGLVLSQQPAPGTRLRRGSRVRLMVAAEPLPKVDRIGRQLVDLPDLTGAASEDALLHLTALGLVGEIAGREKSPRRPGTVLRQAPARQSVPRGTRVQLWVAASAQPSLLAIALTAVDRAGRPVPDVVVNTDAVVVDSGVALPTGATLWSAAFSAEGTRVVTASGDRTARVWDATSGHPLGVFEHPDIVYSAVFGPDGTIVLTASKDGTIRLFAAVNGQLIRQIPRDDVATFASFSPDGRQIVGTYSSGLAQLWDPATGQEGRSFRHGAWVWSAAFSPNGSRLVTASADRTARIWDVATGQPVGAPLQHEGPVHSAVFSADGLFVLTASEDGTAREWRADTGEPFGAPVRHEAGVWSAGYGPRCFCIVTASLDRTVRFWDEPSGQPSGSPLRLAGPVHAVAFSPDGKRLVTASGNVGQLWDWAAVWTGPDGVARSAADARDALTVRLVVPPDFQPAAPFTGRYGPGGLTLRADLSPRGSRWSHWLLEHVDGLRWLGAPLLVLGALSWSLWALYRRGLVLERRASRRAQDLAHVRLPEPRHHLYRGGGFVRARIEARRRQAGPDGELDVEATLDRTLRGLGFFSPVFRPRTRLPAYLALVDRAGFRDQQFRLVEEFLEGLREGGVAVDSYSFDRDPRLCAPTRGQDGTHRNLWELSALHAEHRLLLFGDGAGLADPVTGRAASWTAGFAAWSERAVLTPVPACHWSGHELELAGAGFRVVPFTPAGLRLFVEAGQPDEPRPALLEWQAPYPALLADTPARWCEKAEPRAEEVDELWWQLRAYLGPDGFRWLSGLAVYPEMDWFLTLYIGIGLRAADGVPLLAEEPLLALARLPWLRRGAMPDWLRLRLVAGLPAEDARTLRGLLESLLKARLDGSVSRFQLDLATPPEPGGRRWRRFFADLLRTEPPDSPLQDYVFVEFLMGRRPRRLQVRAPRGWRAFVYHRGLSSLGVRPVAVMACAAVLAAAGSLFARPLAQWIDARLTPATPSRITASQWTPAESTVEVPQVVGLDAVAAAGALQQAGLKLRSTDSAPLGAVITAQAPAAGAIVARGSSVEVRTAPNTGWLQVVNYPSGTSTQRLAIDGVRWNGVNPVPLPGGTHTVSFDAGVYGKPTRSLLILRGQTVRFSLPPEALPARPTVRTVEYGPSGASGTEVGLKLYGAGLRSVRGVEIEGARVDQVSPSQDGSQLTARATLSPDAVRGPHPITLVDLAGNRVTLSQTFDVRPAQPEQNQEQNAAGDKTAATSVPNVVGRTVSGAIAVLQEYRLRYQMEGPGGPQATGATLSRCVVDQAPKPGTRVPLGTAVFLTARSCPTAND